MSAAGGVPKPNWTQVPNRLLDEWLPLIETVGELKVALAIVRQTAGWQRKSAVLSLTQLEGMTGLARSTVVEGLKAAHKRGYVHKVRVGQGFAYGLVVEGDPVVRESDQFDLRSTEDQTSAGSDSGTATSSDAGTQIKKGGKKPSGGKKGGAGKATPPVDSDSVPIWTYDSRTLSSEHRRLALAVHGLYNELAEQSLSAFRPSNGKASESLKRITGAVLDHTGLELDEWQGMIAFTLVDPWWAGAPSPNVIFGPNVIDNNLSRWREKGSPPPGTSVQSGPEAGTTNGEGYDKHVRWD